MKRIIGFLTVICMLLSFCPASFASEPGVRYDAMAADSLGGHNGSTVSGEDIKVIKYINQCGYISATATEAISGTVYAEFKVKINNDGGDKYDDFRLQLINSANAAVVELTFTPQYGEEATKTKINPQPSGSSTNILEYDMLSEGEWVTVYITADTDSKKLDLSVEYSDGTKKSIYSQQNFNKTPAAYDVQKIKFAFNRVTNENYTGGAYFKDFNLYKMLEVTALASPEDKDADINKECTLPTTVTATLENNTTKELAVTWSSPEVTISNGKCTFTQEKEYTLTGIVAESDKTVTLKVNVTKLPEITSLVNPTSGEAEVNVEHTMPSKVTANYDKGEPKEVSVIWSAPGVSVSSGKCTFTEVGTYTFTGNVDGTDKTATYTVVVKPMSITEYEKVEVYLEKYSDTMPKTVKVGYRNGSYGFEAVEWETIDHSATQVQTVTGTIQNYNGNVEPTIEADVYLYDAGDTLFNDDCENYVDGQHIRGQYLSPEPRVEIEDYWGWNFTVPEFTIAKTDPTDETNMAIEIPKNTSELTYSNNYSAIQLGTGREGISVVSFDMLFPETKTDFRMQLLSDGSKSAVEHTIYGATGEVSGVTEPGAFEHGEWVNFKYITNLYTDTYDFFINNVKINQESLNVKTAKQKNIYQIRFANYSTNNEDTEVYVDNIKMYHLTSMLEEAYAEIEPDKNVTGNLSLPTDSSITATWDDGEDNLIENNGTVHSPSWAEGDKNTKVTLKLEKPIGAGYSAQKQATFDLVVRAKSPTDSEAVNATLEWLNFDVIKKDNIADTNIITDLYLPTEGLYGTTISWSGVNPQGPVDSEGKVYAPESADTTVTLTATVSRGSVSLADAPINLTVKYQAELSDLQAVRRAKAQLSIGDTVDSSNTKLSLPSSGENGVSIAWKSLNTDKLSDKGEWQKPSSGGTAVMQAIITKGTARDTKEFNVSVASYSGGGSGGSGGGGGGGGGAMVAPSTTPVVKEPEKITPVYSDINGYDWAHTAIYALTNAGVLTGTGDKKFEPARNVNREEFVAMAVRGFDINTTVSELPFADVSESDWHYETTKKAYGFGLVSGISDGSFGSGMEIRRQDMFVIMYNAAKKLGISLKKVRDASEFADSGDISEYAIEAVTALYEAGIVNGYGDSISPLKSATRAEAAKMIYEIRALYTK